MYGDNNNIVTIALKKKAMDKNSHFNLSLSRITAIKKKSELKSDTPITTDRTMISISISIFTTPVAIEPC
jgi:hypothetical protein